MTRLLRSPATHLALTLLALGAAPLCAQREAKIPNPDPEVERRTFQVPEGFEVNLFAADPLLAKPIQMNWDAAGRLWVASSEVYPQIKPGQKANDKVLVLEDTKGVGKADKVTIFADGLLIPTGVEPGDGGAYVANSTEIVHLSNPGPDGKARTRRVVLSGFGTEDTHHIIHTFRWGHDGQLYFNQAVYIHSHVETPHGVRRLGGGGIWQFRPETVELGVFMRGLWNPWGHHFDRWGQSFATDGAGGEGINYVVPGASYAPVPGGGPTLPGLNPRSPKYCGLEVLSGRHLPEAWRGTLVTNDFRAHRVCRFEVAPSGSAYVSRQLADVIRSTHPAFRPIDVKMGPDGAIYVADWYNPIIQHGEVDFRDPRRDHTRGRIWRITAKGRPLVPRPKLVGATVPELLEHLKAPEDWTRHFAKRVLKERGAKAVLPALKAWAGKLDRNKPADEPHRLEALWTYQSLNVVEPALLSALLEARDYRVRAAATRVASAWHDRLANPLELLAPRIADEHPQVRLEAVRALGKVQSPRAAELALRALERPVDLYLDYGLGLTMRELEKQWVPAMQKGRFNAGNVRQLAFALQAVGSARVVAPLVGLVRSGKLSAEGEDSILTLLAGVGGPGELTLLVDRAVAEKTTRARRLRLLGALEESARQRGVKPAGDLKRVVALLGSDDVVTRAAAARLSGLWGQEGARASLEGSARDAKAPEPLRQAAIDGLAALGGKGARDTLGELAEKGAPPAVRPKALVALAGLDLPGAAKRAVGVLADMKEGAGTSDVFDAFLQRKNGANELAKAVAGKKLPPDVAKVGVRTVRTSGREANALLDALVKAGGLKFGARKLTKDELADTVADVARLGNAARGERIFRRADQLCLQCHAIGGAGGQVGPDLSSIGASAQVDYLIESLLEPSKAIKENYHALLVSTNRGHLLTGIKVRQTRTALVLRTDQDREIEVPLKDVEEQTPSKTSLMPDGLTDTLTRGELLDLVRFLSELGKVGPYSVGKARVARRWEALALSADAKGLLEGKLDAVAGNHPGMIWSPAYSTVAGVLPLAEVPSVAVKDGGLTVLRARLEATAASKARLKIGPARGARLWVDGKEVPVKETTELSLTAGAHVLTLVVERAGGAEAVRCELEDTPAAAGVRFVGGK